MERAAGQSPAGRVSAREAPGSSLGRFAKIVLATVIEGAAIYWWLRLHKDVVGLGSGAAGELLETAFLTSAIGKAGFKRWGELKPNERALPQGRAHHRVGGTLEIGGVGLFERAAQDAVHRTPAVLIGDVARSNCASGCQAVGTLRRCAGTAP